MPELDFPFRLPETQVDRNALKRIVFNVLTEDLSFHAQIKRALCAVGFEITKVQKHWFHSVYEVEMRRGAPIRDDTEKQLRRRIRRALKSENIGYEKETFVVSVQGERIVCAFVYRLGCEGII
jgi:SOS response regulatory protein OraA/RecX